MGDERTWDPPDRIAMCAMPDGEHEYVPLKPDEKAPTSCFADCDCTPVVFSVSPVPSGPGEPSEEAIEAACATQIGAEDWAVYSEILKVEEREDMGAALKVAYAVERRLREERDA